MKSNRDHEKRKMNLFRDITNLNLVQKFSLAVAEFLEPEGNRDGHLLHHWIG